MKKISVKTLFGISGEPTDQPHVPGVLSQAAFQELLLRERARSARNDQGFTVVAFRFGEDMPDACVPQHRRFLRLLVDRVRLTDAVGILSRDEAGVFLPDTGAAGAEVFARRITAAVAEWRLHLVYNIFSHTDEYVPETAVPEAADASGTHCAGTPPLRGIEHYLERPLPRWKRGFDIGMALLGLVLCAPLMALMALHIKATSPGTILFRQERIGYLGRRFVCLKFRTMHMHADPATHRTHLHDLIRSGRVMMKLEEKRDPRIIPFGITLRQAGLDELPQLVNVLRGDMSIVGPRPCIPYEYDEYDPWHRLRTGMPPGLTGLWQINGKNKCTFTEMIRFDIAYARKISLWRDMAIVLRTIPVVAGQVMRC